MTEELITTVTLNIINRPWYERVVCVNVPFSPGVLKSAPILMCRRWWFPFTFGKMKYHASWGMLHYIQDRHTGEQYLQYITSLTMQIKLPLIIWNNMVVRIYKP